MVRVCAIYCRVSTADQSCKRQEEDLLAFAKRAGYEIVSIQKEVRSGVKLDPPERKKVMALAQARQIDAILVTELSRWGRSTVDLLATLQKLEAWGVSLIAQSGTEFDLKTPHGKMLAGFLAVLAEFERDLLRERIKSGIASARARGKRFGRVKGFKPKTGSEKVRVQVLQRVANNRPYRAIAKELDLSTTTITVIVREFREEVKKLRMQA